LGAEKKTNERGPPAPRVAGLGASTFEHLNIMKQKARTAIVKQEAFAFVAIRHKHNNNDYYQVSD
jgi:hypothetical protein